ncbi:TonB-dependent receptor [Flavobacterium sp.]|uniref:TonB-dependent receptor family protein n=1 Tax=Flavobacterium sp. TaxID=239 RepID=UPI00262D36E8|nr:TonB-dependent receptor [Flavobacterium sp.]
MKLFISFCILCFSTIVFAQQDLSDLVQNDTVKKLSTVTIIVKQQTPERLHEVENNTLFSGKKNEVIRLANLNANVTTNNAREVFSKVPGVSVWENEGSGIQINVGVRGLSPNRSWELNTRQNGYDISSDVFGYPEAYYNPPLEAVDAIQLLRGGASLQFGSQFGGMLNYVLKRETEKPFSFETQNTLGSYGLMSSYNAIGGKKNRFSYYVYNHFRTGKGWRENSGYEVRNSHAYFAYQFTPNTKLSLEYTNMDYEMQQAGGLTDVQFKDNPRQSLRERNWFGIPWNVAALVLDTKLSSQLTLNTKLFGLLGERNSVGFTATPNTIDAISTTTNDYANRQVDRDFYKNLGIETRSIYTYKLGKQDQNLAFGLRLYQANTTRKQKGKGTTASDFDLEIDGRYSRDLDFQTDNIALFAENQFKINNHLSITSGIRYENIKSSIDGRLGITTDGNDDNVTPESLSRNKILMGIGVEYKLHKTNFYANFSRAFRPVLFSDITLPATTDVIDPDLKDADGFNADFGYRGNLLGWINFDVGFFYLNYDNKIGLIRKFVNDPTPRTYQFRTNLGTAIHKGIESFVDLNISKALKVNQQIGDLQLFTTMSFIDARYEDYKVTKPSETAPNVLTESNLKGNRVENAPRYIHNFGLTWSYKSFSSTVQNRRTGLVYTDSDNTETPPANGLTGKLNGYSVYDLSMEYRFLEKFNIRAGINNLDNTVYATRRASGYPGPGILPNDARTFFLSVGVKL